jgi:hypothetical protein
MLELIHHVGLKTWRIWPVASVAVMPYWHMWLIVAPTLVNCWMVMTSFSHQLEALGGRSRKNEVRSSLDYPAFYLFC